ncbi:hypothetical protein GCM10010211_84620 [Streptomyces albospinus]|uniref:Uncharacterized protein n=1 Tax=Streptomyces albospinus TaxID=285515 RepID=A0ABQ2VRP5_9ACTN|nr:hypothetical protein GCM10010211_84620 [Streptomyces albospinus]
MPPALSTAQRPYVDGALSRPTGRQTTRGTATSIYIYIHDPHTNTLELRWHPQDAGPSDTH